MKITVLIPCYNESNKVVDLFQLIHSLNFMSRTDFFDLDFLLVDNGCTDDTFLKIENEAFAHISCCQSQTFQIPKNMGYGYGVKSGLVHTHGKNVCILPADGKYGAKDILESTRLFHAIGSSDFLVKGIRINRNDPTVIQLLSFLYTNLVNFLAGARVKDVNGLPKIFCNDFAFNEINLMSNMACFDANLLFLWVRKGRYIKEFPVTFTQNLIGDASWSGKRTITTLKMFWELVRTTLRIRIAL